ncbi:MAG TPA: PD-(D/E)XK nuclease family protein [Trueperaceae bacterium]
MVDREAARFVVTSARLGVEPPPQAEGLILPNRQAARSLGVPYRSLEGLAQGVIRSRGVRIAPKVVAHRMLRLAVVRSGAGSDPGGIARAAESTLRELLRAGVDLDALGQVGNRRVERLAAIAVSYRRLLAQEGLIDAAELLWRASELVMEPVRLQLRGFPRLPAAERAFLDAVAAPGSTIQLPLPADGAPLFAENLEALSDFRARGWVTRQEQQPGTERAEGPGTLGVKLAEEFLTGRSESRRANLACYAYPDLEAESRGTLALVKRLLRRGVSPGRIAIVARDEESYGPTLLAVAEEYGVPLRVLYQVPLAQARFGAWLAELLEALESHLPFEETARVLAHPLVNGLDGETWAEVRSEHTSGWEAWRARLPYLGEAWPASADRREFIERLESLVSDLGAPRNALAWAREARAVTIFFEELRSLPGRSAEVTLEEFIAEAAELLNLLTVPAQPGRGGVELHTPLSLFGASVDHLFVVGAAEGILPSPVRPDPLLDPFEREELGAGGFPVEDVATEARREELSLWALLHSAGTSLTLSLPRLLGRSEAFPSPFLARLGVEPTDPPPAAICSDRELRLAELTGEERFDEVLERARHAYKVEVRRESDAPYDGHDGMVGIPYLPPPGGLAVTALVSLASCPFRFFGERVLRLDEPDEAADSLEPSLRGKLFHEVLQSVMESVIETDRGFAEVVRREPDADTGERANATASEDVGGRASGPWDEVVSGESPAGSGWAGADPRAVALARLDEAFERAEEELQLTSLPTWPLERSQHLRVLRRAIASERFIREGARVLELESPFQGRWRGIPVRGRVDRMDALADGIELLDYKSGSSISNLAKDEDGRPKVDLQLSIYREVAGAALAPNEPVAGSRYFSVSRAEDLRAATPSDEQLDTIAEGVKRAWREGAYPVDPDIDGAACRYCPLDPVCRKGPRLERKRHRP